MEEVERISTHICVMDGGRCRAFGSKEELLETPEGRITLAELYTRLCGQQ
jgi:ABC-type multidrug transport system ATPase subunit